MLHVYILIFLMSQKNWRTRKLSHLLIPFELLYFQFLIQNGSDYLTEQSTCAAFRWIMLVCIHVTYTLISF